MARQKWLILSTANPWVIGWAFAVGVMVLLAGLVALATGAWFWGVVGAGFGAWLLTDAVSTLRVYRANRGWLDAVRAFRTAVRALQSPPTLYVNDELGLEFLHLTSRRLWFRSDLLIRATIEEARVLRRMLDDGETVPFVVEEFEIRSGVTMVFKTVEGGRVKLDKDGEPVMADVDQPHPGLLRAIRSRHQALVAGLLQATEADLTEVCAQLAAARPNHPRAEEDGTR